MTTRPELRIGPGLLPGVLAVALFAAMAAIVLNTSFDAEMAGFPADVSVTASIGYALFDLAPLQGERGVPGTEPFLLAFLLVAVVLDAALDAALVLAKREEDGEPVTALSGSRAGSLTGSGRAVTGGSESASENGGTRGGRTATDGGESGQRVDSGRSAQDDGRSAQDDGRSAQDDGGENA